MLITISDMKIMRAARRARLQDARRALWSRRASARLMLLRFMCRDAALFMRRGVKETSERIRDVYVL